MDSDSPYDLTQLIRAIAEPESDHGIEEDVLTELLGLGQDPDDRGKMKEYARRRVEKEFLQPVKDLEDEYIGHWQMLNPVDIPIPKPELETLPATHTVIPLLRGLDGIFSGWKEIYAPPPAPAPTASGSTERKPGGMMTFVRGKGNYVPFRPGGLDEDAFKEGEVGEEESEEDRVRRELEEEEAMGKTWKTIAPGMKRGLKLDGANEFLRSVLGEASFTAPVKRRKRPKQQIGVGNDMQDGAVELDDNMAVQPHRAARNEDRSEIDDLLPISRLPAPPTTRRRRGPPKREWAHVVDVNQPMENFHEMVPEMAHKYPFELDTFQKEAVYHLEMGDSVFVAAHTSAGKTVVAEYAISLAMKHMTRAIYTSPIKALSNQKFRDFKTTYGAENVGILTGDVQINPEAPCLIMTTEILRSMLYRGADLIRDVEFVIFDEVHYVNDAERGVVWEEVIIMLPEHINIILLSATVPNTHEFASWVGRTKKKDIYVISTPKRPVPLEHYLWAGKELHKIVDASSHFLSDGYKAAGESLKRKQEKEREAAGLPPLQRTGGRGMTARGGARGLPNGRGTPPARGGRGGAQTGRGGSNGVTHYGAHKSYGGAGSMDKNLWSQLVNHLKKIDLLPVVVFTFSKKRCEANAASLSAVDLNVASEKSEVHVTVEKALTRLKGSDKKLPQIARMRELLMRGIGVHHGGLLPIVKEVVEILFSRGLVKVLFATETFAMGVNMPAKSVVFSHIRKHDGTNFRTLEPGEYTQMAGRAGRRGLDSTGTVIIIGGDELPEQSTLTEMMLGTPNKLTSQFRLTYNMILNLLRVEALRVEEMIKRSFSENASQALAPEQQRQVEATERRLAKLAKVDCDVCSADIEAFYDVSAEVARKNTLLIQAAATHHQGNKTMSSGRVVLLYDKHFRGNLGIILRPSPGLVDPDSVDQPSDEGLRTYWVFALVSKATKDKEDDFEAKTAPPRWRVSLDENPLVEPTWEIVTVATSSINLVVNRVEKVDVNAVLDKCNPEAIESTLSSIKKIYDSLKQSETLPEVEWTRMRQLDFQEALKARNNLAERLKSMSCSLCADFSEHYEILHERKLIEVDLQQLKLALSDQNLELLPDYEQRVDVLKHLQFIDENATVLLKGRVACEINSSNELVLTELILDNILADYTAEEVVALLSVFIFVEKTESAPEIPEKVQQGLDVIYGIAERIEAVQDAHSVRHDEFVTQWKHGLVEVVYEWAKGMPFDQITDLTDVPEGTIVRCITRLDETCREVRDAARVIGDRDLFEKMEEAQALIKRDIVFAASLYF
ncbi:Antiviral helicase ski2 [Naganishia albida]|nr:Antiviral helicase ski2 [Naganishia albida]